MIGKKHEYALMHQSETTHWWYRHLHNQVGEVIQQRFLPETNPDILDAGCGTGGLLLRLQQMGYNNLLALDASTDAVAFATAKTEVPVKQGYIQETAMHFHGQQFDIICCMDVLTYLVDEEIVAVLQQFAQMLKPGGIIITNNNAFKAFKGTHDHQVGIIKRFTAKDFERYATAAGCIILKNRYWNFLLSPMVWAIRKWKLLQHYTGITHASEISSDLTVPSPFINNSCLQILKLENKIVSPPWGTSVFSVLQHKP